MGRYALSIVVAGALISLASTAEAAPCVATCDGAGFSEETKTKVATLIEPSLQTVRSCSAGVSGVPAIVVTTHPDGSLRRVLITRIEAGGQEKLACMPKISSLTPDPGALEMRCELRCGAPPAAPPPVAPAVVPSSPNPAPVETPPSPAPAPATTTTSEPQTLWYGWQTLLADSGALLLAVLAGAAESPALGGFSYAAYLLAPPIIHVVHGRVGAGFASLGMRVVAAPGAAVIGALLAAAADPDVFDETATPTGVAVGFGVGLFLGWGASVAIDAAVLARSEKVEAPTPKPQAMRVRPSLVLTPTPRGGFLSTAGVTGTF